MQRDTSKTNNEQISLKYRKSIIAPNKNVALEQMVIPHCRLQTPYSNEGRKSGSIYVLDGSTAIEEVKATLEGGIDFTVTDSKNTITNAAIRCFKNDSMVRCATTGYDGSVKLQFTDTGHYTVTVSYSGKKQMKIPVQIEQGSNSTSVTCTLKNAVLEIIRCGTIISYKKPLINPYMTNYVINAMEIKPRPTTNNSDLLSFAPGIFQVRTNAPISSDGARTTGNLYVADGIVLLPGL